MVLIGLGSVGYGNRKKLLLVQYSPKIKSSPKELSSSVMFGDFSCNIPHSIETASQPAPSFGSSSKLNLNSTDQCQVSAKLVFGRLKSHLVNSDPGQLHAAQSKVGVSTHTSIDTNFLHCKRCLGWGHRVRDFSGAIRCWFCFHYGHIQ